MTEVSMFVTCEDSHVPVPAASTCVGKLAFYAQGRTVDDQGNILPRGQTGNLQLKSLTAMKGYWRNEEATRKVITVDGWIDSGDVGYQDEEGNWHITGREKEMMKIGGEYFIVSRLVTLPEQTNKFQFYSRPYHLPLAIEGTLLSHPDIAHAIVIGIHTKAAEDRPAAYIVKAAGATLDEHEVMEWMREQMSDVYKLTGGVYFIGPGELKYGGNGKVDRKGMKERAQRVFEKGKGLQEITVWGG
jgi:acyl-CoA synthetase (AMP-forming)/AMP-acid ligase II